MTSPARLSLLENVHSKEGAAVLKLVKLLLPSLSNYEDLDQLVAPQIVRLVEHCMRCATRSSQPLGYLQIVRAVFKAANPQAPYNSKLRACQQELAPHLSTYLTCFTTWLAGPNVGNLRALLVELCLMLPVQMSGLIPLLPRMARPLLNALSQVNPLPAGE
jgi:transformation/transcription domain-associated protein